MNNWVRRCGTGSGQVARVVPGEPGWSWTGLDVVDLAAGEELRVAAGSLEHIVLPLSGGAEVTVAGLTHRLAGRADVFAGPSDLVYVGRDQEFTVRGLGGGRIALAAAVASQSLPTCHLPAGEVPVELRGAGRASRQVRNFGVPGVLEADSIIACEVITPAGNWSSYPPHKHDQSRPGVETELEEIYYFEMRAEPGSDAGDPIGYQRVYGTAERPIEVLAEVRSGDVVLVPHGWHGPAMAPPGYDMYYLNVMAGPGEERAWLICDDPAHSWVRQAWKTQAADPRIVPIPSNQRED